MFTYYPPHLGGMENVAKAIAEVLARTRPVEVVTTTCGAKRCPRVERQGNLMVWFSRRLRGGSFVAHFHLDNISPSGRFVRVGQPASPAAWDACTRARPGQRAHATLFRPGSFCCHADGMDRIRRAVAWQAHRRPWVQDLPVPRGAG
jgi:hypothetical protein